MLQAPEDCMLPLCFEPRESVIKLGSAGSCMLLAESGKFCFGQWGVSWWVQFYEPYAFLKLRNWPVVTCSLCSASIYGYLSKPHIEFKKNILRIRWKLISEVSFTVFNVFEYFQWSCSWSYCCWQRFAEPHLKQQPCLSKSVLTCYRLFKGDLGVQLIHDFIYWFYRYHHNSATEGHRYPGVSLDSSEGHWYVTCAESLHFSCSNIVTSCFYYSLSLTSRGTKIVSPLHHCSEFPPAV